MPNRSKVIGRVRHDRHAVAHGLLSPRLQPLERLHQRAILEPSTILELFPLANTDLL
jgi:hypothetical protein